MNIGSYEMEVITFFMLVVPALFYVMGMMEGKWADRAFSAGIVLHLASLGQRWFATGRLPFAEKHDNISLAALAMALAYIYLKRRRGMRELGLSVIPLIAITMFVSMAHRTVDIISPFMESPWFYLHTFTYFTAYGLFAVSACLGGHFVIKGAQAHEQYSYRMALYGWMLLSVSFLAGSIWFYRAYGTYWLWTSKELWVTITWLYYGMYLHTRMVKGLRGRPAAIIGIIGFAVALFAYFGVGRIIPSPPTQF